MLTRKTPDNGRRGVWMTTTAAALAAAACGGGEPTPRVAMPPVEYELPDSGVAIAAPPPPPPAPSCPAKIDLADLFARNGVAFGTPAAIEAELPLTFRGTFTQGTAHGPYELVVAREGYRATVSIAGFDLGDGIDKTGPWTLPIAGVVERLHPGESTDIDLDAWLIRRGYLQPIGALMDAMTSAATCELVSGAPRVTVPFTRDDRTQPRLTFDLATAALLSVAHEGADGKRSTFEYATWHPADAHGVRWPSHVEQHDAVNVTTSTIEAPTPGLSCSGGGDCLAPLAQKVAFAWPASGVVRVPIDTSMGELGIKVHYGDRDVWALLDSGAMLSTIDAYAPAAKTFTAAGTIQGSGVTEKVTFGLGTLAPISIGGLTVRDLPAARVPISALDAYGTNRPELILGFSIFAGAWVRVDYAKRELVIARADSPLATSNGLFSKKATAIDVRVLNGKLVAPATIDGKSGVFEIDTGNDGGFDPNKSWTSRSGLPGAHKTLVIRGKFGAGDSEAETVRFRFDRAELGPVVLERKVASIFDPPDTGAIAGLIGNDAFARCNAVVFDEHGRKLWFEPPCDRPRPEHRGAWHITNDGKDPKHPWIVTAVLAGGSAEAGGAKVGDRLVTVAGVPVTLDRAPIDRALEKPVGTKVPVTVLRDGAVVRLTLQLVELP